MGASSSIAAATNHHGWSVDDVCHWLRSIWMDEFESKFRSARVDGSKLLSMDGASAFPRRARSMHCPHLDLRCLPVPMPPSRVRRPQWTSCWRR